MSYEISKVDSLWKIGIDNMALLKKDIDYFNNGKFENPRFWSKFEGKPIFKDANVLDIGCGHGSLCIDIALSDAKKVIGLDLNSRLIEFADENLRINYPELRNIVEFKNIDIKDYPNNINFDYIVSKDSFEHILDLKEVLIEMKNRLKQRCKIYVGFAPLYNSPFGDHGRTKTKIPWGHLIVPESIIIKRLNKHRKDKISSIQELGLNKWSLSDYEKLFKVSGLSIVFFKVNHSESLLAKLVNMISKIPLLKEYFSHNLFCILEKI